MITESGILREFTLISKCGWRRVTGTPCQWDEASGKFKQEKYTFRKSSMFITFNAISLPVYFLQKLLSLKFYAGGPIEMNLLQIAVALLSEIAYILLGYFSLHVFLESDLIEYFINQMAAFEKQVTRQSTQAWKKALRNRNMARLALWTCRLTRMTNTRLIPKVVAFITVILPGLPINMLQYYPQKALLEISGLLGGKFPYAGMGLEKVVTFLWNMVLWEFLAKNWGTLITQVVAGCIGLSTVTLSLQRDVENGMRSCKDFTASHRQINILADIFNKLESNLLVILLSSVMGYEIISGFVLLGKHASNLGSANLLMAYFFGLSFITGILIIILAFGFCADVHDTSSKCLKKIGMNVGMMGFSKAKQNKRMIRSLPVVKIHFGGVNFIEKLTPIIFQHFATDMLIDCLLLNKAS